MDDLTEKRRHSAAHVLAMAVLRLFPEAKLGVGPVTKQGFYHDFEAPRRLKWDDVKRIESEMNLIIQEDLPFNQLYTSPQEAFQLLMSRGQVYKSELLNQIQDPRISFYKTGEEFIDLCRGPHVSSTNQIGAIKLTSITDVHWLNDEDRPQMQRISGVAFSTPTELNTYLAKQEAVQDRDFVKLGQELELFLGEQKLLFTGSGAVTLQSIRERLAYELEQLSYDELMPQSYSNPQQFLEDCSKIYKIKNRSYRNLPLRMLGTNIIEGDNSTEIQGKKVLGTNQLQSVSYCVPGETIDETLANTEAIIKTFQYLNIAHTAEIHTADLKLSLIPKLTNQLKENKISQTQVIDATAPNQGAIINFITVDELDREWHLARLRVRPSDVEYVNEEGDFSVAYQVEVNYVLEQILAYYLENNEGALPYWASPLQIAIIPIAEAQYRYARTVMEDLAQAGMRSQVDARAETMQSRIRSAELNKVPVIIILGEKEEKGNAVSVRFRNKQELGMISREGLSETLYEHLQNLDK